MQQSRRRGLVVREEHSRGGRRSSPDRRYVRHEGLPRRGEFLRGLDRTVQIVHVGVDRLREGYPRRRLVRALLHGVERGGSVVHQRRVVVVVLLRLQVVLGLPRSSLVLHGCIKSWNLYSPGKKSPKFISFFPIQAESKSFLRR